MGVERGRENEEIKGEKEWGLKRRQGRGEGGDVLPHLGLLFNDCV